ncbi:MAG TPA: hypothetical protein PKI14_15715 [Fervidobacterium sp.]|uniref:hypothetical protein n=1 Tax=Acetomicrobium mobile TaxID=97477 RepID=UPI0026EC56A9|nr:hypothetical protein [Acetomicrobium mobile]HUM44391.1 hypothetical protein [Fervidobacterium sp.]
MIELDIWLYGSLAKYTGEDKGSYAQLRWKMPDGTRVRDLLKRRGNWLMKENIRKKDPYFCPSSSWR